ncbi:hypothetical protein N3K66_008278 [Trichothecium roseum]|uniref:Uncharacterized protein n=1 Tax=Trichothecium roseum TaxID=47278 RepID=A0ACC0UUC3_9HYPO|nr:hypothetical protein N3K66_008278 [Trichothecium roseum]
MAQKAKKDRAKANAAALNNLHIGSAVAHAVFLAFNLALASPSSRRSLLAYALLSAPGLACEYALESSGRPRRDPATGALRSSGEDLAAPGLTEYMFDVVWVTWASLACVVVFGDWGWLLWGVVPAYGLYMGSGLLGMGKQMLTGGGMMGGAGGGGGEQAAAAPQGNRRSRRAA